MSEQTAAPCSLFVDGGVYVLDGLSFWLQKSLGEYNYPTYALVFQYRDAAGEPQTYTAVEIKAKQHALMLLKAMQAALRIAAGRDDVISVTVEARALEATGYVDVLVRTLEGTGVIKFLPQDEDRAET